MGITQIDAFVDAAEGPFAEATKAEVFGGDFRSYFGEWGVRCRFYGRHGVGVSVSMQAIIIFFVQSVPLVFIN